MEVLRDLTTLQGLVIPVSSLSASYFLQWKIRLNSRFSSVRNEMEELPVALIQLNAELKLTGLGSICS